jgi:hypothetical protein
MTSAHNVRHGNADQNVADTQEQISSTKVSLTATPLDLPKVVKEEKVANPSSEANISNANQSVVVKSSEVVPAIEEVKQEAVTEEKAVEFVNVPSDETVHIQTAEKLTAIPTTAMDTQPSLPTLDVERTHIRPNDMPPVKKGFFQRIQDALTPRSSKAAKAKSSQSGCLPNLCAGSDVNKHSALDLLETTDAPTAEQADTVPMDSTSIPAAPKAVVQDAVVTIVEAVSVVTSEAAETPKVLEAPAPKEEVVAIEHSPVASTTNETPCENDSVDEETVANEPSTPNLPAGPEVVGTTEETETQHEKSRGRRGGADAKRAEAKGQAFFIRHALPVCSYFYFLEIVANLNRSQTIVCMWLFRLLVVQFHTTDGILRHRPSQTL